MGAQVCLLNFESISRDKADVLPKFCIKPISLLLHKRSHHPAQVLEGFAFHQRQESLQVYR